MRRGACRSVPLRPPVPPLSARAARLRGPRLGGRRGPARRAARTIPPRARSVPRRARGGAAARRPGAPSAPLRRPSPQPGAYLCAAPRGRSARAEHLTVSIAHGSLARRPFLVYYNNFLSLTRRLHPLPLCLQLAYATGVHTLSHLRANAGPPTPAAVRRGEVGSTRWAALAHDVRRSAAHRARGSAATDSPSA